MFKKIALISLGSVLLGGCSLPSFLSQNNAAVDTQPGSTVTTTSTPVPTASVTTSPDAALQAMPSTSTTNDAASLEKDINNTQITPEDFSNIK
jgi:hypothetical protein